MRGCLLPYVTLAISSSLARLVAATASIPAAVGYETGTPAYPDPIENPSHRERRMGRILLCCYRSRISGSVVYLTELPLTVQELTTITQQTQPQFSGGFFWEVRFRG